MDNPEGDSSEHHPTERYSDVFSVPSRKVIVISEPQYEETSTGLKQTGVDICYVLSDEETPFIPNMQQIMSLTKQITEKLIPEKKKKEKSKDKLPPVEEESYEQTEPKIYARFHSRIRPADSKCNDLIIPKEHTYKWSYRKHNETPSESDPIPALKLIPSDEFPEGEAELKLKLEQEEDRSVEVVYKKNVKTLDRYWYTILVKKRKEVVLEKETMECVTCKEDKTPKMPCTVCNEDTCDDQKLKVCGDGFCEEVRQVEAIPKKEFVPCPKLPRTTILIPDETIYTRRVDDHSKTCRPLVASNAPNNILKENNLSKGLLLGIPEVKLKEEPKVPLTKTISKNYVMDNKQPDSLIEEVVQIPCKDSEKNSETSETPSPESSASSNTNSDGTGSSSSCISSRNTSTAVTSNESEKPSQIINVKPEEEPMDVPKVKEEVDVVPQSLPRLTKIFVKECDKLREDATRKPSPKVVKPCKRPLCPFFPPSEVNNNICPKISENIAEEKPAKGPLPKRTCRKPKRSQAQLSIDTQSSDITLDQVSVQLESDESAESSSNRTPNNVELDSDSVTRLMNEFTSVVDQELNPSSQSNTKQKVEERKSLPPNWIVKSSGTQTCVKRTEEGPNTAQSEILLQDDLSDGTKVKFSPLDKAAAVEPPTSVVERFEMEDSDVEMGDGKSYTVFVCSPHTLKPNKKKKLNTKLMDLLKVPMKDAETFMPTEDTTSIKIGEAQTIESQPPLVRMASNSAQVSLYVEAKSLDVQTSFTSSQSEDETDSTDSTQYETGMIPTLPTRFNFGYPTNVRNLKLAKTPKEASFRAHIKITKQNEMREIFEKKFESYYNETENELSLESSSSEAIISVSSQHDAFCDDGGKSVTANAISESIDYIRRHKQEKIRPFLTSKPPPYPKLNAENMTLSADVQCQRANEQKDSLGSSVITNFSINANYCIPSKRIENDGFLGRPGTNPVWGTNQSRNFSNDNAFRLPVEEFPRREEGFLFPNKCPKKNYRNVYKAERDCPKISTVSDPNPSRMRLMSKKMNGKRVIIRDNHAIAKARNRLNYFRKSILEAHKKDFEKTHENNSIILCSSSIVNAATNTPLYQHISLKQTDFSTICCTKCNSGDFCACQMRVA